MRHAFSRYVGGDGNWECSMPVQAEGSKRFAMGIGGSALPECSRLRPN